MNLFEKYLYIYILGGCGESGIKIDARLMGALFGQIFKKINKKIHIYTKSMGLLP